MYIIKAIFSTSRFIISEIKLIKILEVVCLLCSCTLWILFKVLVPKKSSECLSLLVFFSGSLRSGVETVGGVREKERELLPFATGLVPVEIPHPNQFLHSLRGRCKKGRRGEKKMGRGISPRSPLFPIPLLFPLLDNSF